MLFTFWSTKISISASAVMIPGGGVGGVAGDGFSLVFELAKFPALLTFPGVELIAFSGRFEGLLISQLAKRNSRCPF